MSDDYICDYCGEVIEPSSPWVGLNRYACGTGEEYIMSETIDDRGYVWDQEERFCMTARLLHYPDCVSPFLEGKMIQAKVDYRNRNKE